jgi:signal transduction histidine kinase
MSALTTFFEHNIIVVYFFYGLAFFCMGLIVWIESGRASSFRLAQAMGPLAGFGIIHGLHEWFEMFQLIADANATNIPAWLLLDELRIGHLVVSFALLVVFGVRLIYALRRETGNEQLFAYGAAGALVVVWFASTAVTRWLYQPTAAEFLTAVDVLARYILSVPGAILAAWGIVLEQRSFKRHDMPGTGRDLLRAALALIFYGVVGQGFPKASFLFPATVLNADLFLRTFGVPVQLFRAIMASLVAIFVIRALRAFEVERQRNLATANEARLAAQREALAVQQAARAESEKLNRELQTAVQDLTLLFELSRTLASTLDREALLWAAITQITSNLPRIEGGSILIRQQPQQPLQCLVTAGCQDCAALTAVSSCQPAQVIGEAVLRNGQPVCYSGPEKEMIPFDLNQPDGDLSSLEVNGAFMLGVPLKIQDEVTACLVLCLNPDVSGVATRDLSLIGAIAGQLSIAIENATRYQEAQAREALRGELLHQVVSAQERERQRIARELHDGTGQALTALGLGFAAAGESVQSDPALASQQLAELKTMSIRALQELRDLIGNLRPSVLDDLGLIPALKTHIQAFEARTAVSVEFIRHGRHQRVRTDMETIVFRIAQEALTNIAKHAQAQHATVQLNIADEALYLTIQDDGCGFDPEEILNTHGPHRHAWGLLGMQERVALVGGSCEIISKKGGGTTIAVCLPLPDEEAPYGED